MGIPIEPRLNNAALVKRQRLAALRRARHAFHYVSSEHHSAYGIYQHNLDNLISHALQHPPRSARLILVRKELSTPVPITSNTSSFIRLLPIFMRHARQAMISNTLSVARAQLSNPSSRHSHSSHHQNSPHRTHDHRPASTRSSVARESRMTALLHFNRIAAPYTTTRTSSQPLNAFRRTSSSAQDIHARLLTRNAAHFYHHNVGLDPSMREIRHALRQSMLLVASANSASRTQHWGRFHDRVASDNASNRTTRPSNNSSSNNSNNARDRPPSFQRPNPRSQRSSSTNSTNRFRTSALVSDKAISVLYEVDTGCLWELGCWVGTQHLGRTDIFGILVEVLEKTSQVPGSPVEALCIRDDLFSYSTVRGGVRLLQELSGQLIDNYDRANNFFVHPMNDQRVQIIVSP